ncbi:hypothetical protein FHT16_000226 [Xanthomonas arboricola]
MGVIAQCGRTRTRHRAVATLASVVAIWTLSSAGIARDIDIASTVATASLIASALAQSPAQRAAAAEAAPGKVLQAAPSLGGACVG